jgi:rare lipoprotein A
MGRSSASGRRWPRAGRGAALAGFLSLAGCGSTPPAPEPLRPPMVEAQAPGSRGHFKVGRPYEVNGRWYHPSFMTYYEATGTASWYGARQQGRPTANGETYDRHALTAAHPTLQLPSVVRVINLANGRSLRVRVNDRGPFTGDRLIALSQAAARALGFEEQGLAEVHVIYLGVAPLDEPPIRPGDAREYTALSCELLDPDRLIC